jgi:tRNA A-37 threonylcarbamoyl transferase component Bud32
MEVKFKYYFIILVIIYCSALFSEQYSIDSTYIWYAETSITDEYFHQIQMLSLDQGFCISCGKETIYPGNLYQYKNGQWHTIRSFPSSVPKNLALFKQRGETYLWTSSYHLKTNQHAIHFYNGRNWLDQYIQDFPSEKSPFSPHTYLHGYNPQSIWLISDNGETYNYDGISWKTNIPVFFNSAHKKKNLSISAIFVANPSEVWACSRDGYIFHFMENRWEIDTVIVRLKNSEIQDIYFEGGKGWAAGEDGYFLTYKNKRWQTKQFNPEWNFHSIKVFSDNNILLAGEHNRRGILIQLINGKLIFYRFLKDTNPGKIYDMDGFFFSSENRYKIWLSAENGIFSNTLRTGVSFSDVTSKYNMPSSAQGGIFFDLDNDLDSDVLLLSDMLSPYRIYLNDGLGVYTEYNLLQEIKADKNLSAAAIGDIDNDNKVDIVFTDNERNLSVLHQRRILKFVLQKIDLISIPEESSVTLRFWDFDLDGFLDLLIAINKMGLYCLLNNGYGQFYEKIALNIPIQEGSNPVSITPYDVNVDGFTDIYLVYQAKDNELWFNNGKGDFIKNEDPLYTKISGSDNRVCLFQDFNRDHWPDLYVYDGKTSGQIKLNKKLLTISESQILNIPLNIPHLSYENGIIAAGDINHDYFPDLYVSERLLINNQGLQFFDFLLNTKTNFQGNPSFVDFDNDNDLDIFIAGKVPNSNDLRTHTTLLLNNLEKRDAIKLRFDCLKNNRLGIGSWVWLYKTDGGNIARSEYCASKYIGFEGNPLIQESILPITIPVDEDILYSVIVRFPDGSTQTYNNIKPNTVFIIHDLPLFSRFQAQLRKIIKLATYQTNWLIEIIKFIIILVALFWLLFKYQYLQKYNWIIKSIICLIVIFTYLIYFFMESNTPYDITHWVFFIIFPVILVILPLSISFFIRMQHLELISHYKIIKFLGEGGMGKVYKAKDMNSSKLYAIKVLDSAVTLDEEGKKRFQLMERLRKEIKHPNVMRIIDTGIWRNQSYFIMEYLKGKTLRQLMDKKELFSLKEILSISQQIASALKEIHKKSIVHRDVKPDNIFITEHNVIKLMDFDLARIEKPGSETKIRTLLGTLSYMSPQQAVGEAVDHRSDIYSLGVIMYELAAGRLPFMAERDMTLIYEKFKNKPIPIRKLRKNFPTYLEKCIFKAMSKNIEDRFNKIDELITELKKIQDLLKKRKYYRMK